MIFQSTSQSCKQLPHIHTFNKVTTLQLQHRITYFLLIDICTMHIFISKLKSNQKSKKYQLLFLTLARLAWQIADKIDQDANNCIPSSSIPNTP